MKHEFSNRLTMFDSSMGILQDPARKPVWFQLNPMAFTTKVAGTVTALAALEQFCQQQGIDITGAAVDKRVERGGLSSAAHSLGGALTTWFEDHNDLTDAAKVNYPLSVWQHFGGEDLKAHAQTVFDLANTLATGTNAVAAAAYDITPAAVKELGDQMLSFNELVTAPQQALGDRKSLTAQLRLRFNAVEAMFVQLDRLILRFNGTTEGLALIAAYQATRIVRNYGVRHEQEQPAPAPAAK
jgi:hypothetical protein